MTIFDVAIGFCAFLAAFITLRARRRRDRADPLPKLSPLVWQDLLDDRLPQVARLTPAQRRDFHAKVETFLEGKKKKRFVGCNGLEVTDQMRALIAGMACLMVLRPGERVFPRLRKILLYPGPFLVPVADTERFAEVDGLRVVSDDPEERIGESWHSDQVVLSWPDVEAALDGDEINVVVHEFAHQLDAGLGAPALDDYGRWSGVMGAEFERLRRHRRPPVLDPYGAEDPAEFFGVVTEAFFQRGDDLKRHHPELYRLMSDYYCFETAAPVATSGALEMR